MLRAVSVRPSGQWEENSAADCVTLDSSERYRRRIALTGEDGLTFLLDLAQATFLRDGDGLVLDDGRIVRVAGRREPLVEVTARSAGDLARLAWHVGNRHVEVQIVNGRLRMRRDQVIENMLASLGAKLMPISAVFEPEPGAYDDSHDDAA
jgi:urease accessory protein